MAAKRVSVTSVTPKATVKAVPKAQQARTRKLIAGIATTAIPVGRAIKVSGAAAKAASNLGKAKTSGMTKTVIKKVSPDVKVLKPGSRPLTQSASEKAAVKAKSVQSRKSAVLAKRAKVERKQEIQRNRNYILNNVYRDALEQAGFKGGSFKNVPTAAQTKAANKAVAAKEFALKWNKKLNKGKK